MSYESPIEIAEKMSNQVEKDIMEVVLSYGIKVDKDELVKALSYDRKQYEKGYADAKAELERKKGKWIFHIDDLFPEESTQECSVCHEEESIKIQNDNFCPNCGADMRGERE